MKNLFVFHVLYTFYNEIKFPTSIEISDMDPRESKTIGSIFSLKSNNGATVLFTTCPMGHLKSKFSWSIFFCQRALFVLCHEKY